MHTNWSDLRFILQLAEHGTIAAAARALAVNYSTVLRRVNAYELAHDARLFDRHPNGYTLTVAGVELVSVLRGADVQLAELERKVAGHDSKLEGRERITTTDSLAFTVLGRLVASLISADPRIDPEINVNNGHLDVASTRCGSNLSGLAVSRQQG